MSTTPTVSAAGSVKAIWGTSKARDSFGIVITSHTQAESSEQSTLPDENGNTVYIAHRNKSWSVSIDGVMLLDESNASTYANARKAITVGASVTLPTNRALRSLTGLPIVESVNENTSNGDFASLSFTAVVREGITTAITDDTTASAS